MTSFSRTSERKSFSAKSRRPGAGEGGVRTKPRQSARSYSLWLLSRKEYSAKQLRDKLMQRGYSPEEADDALAYVQESRYQDDARFAHIKASSSARQHGDRHVRQALAEQGIDAELVAQELEQLAPEYERACAVARRFEGKPADAQLQQKVLRYLTYRGFSFAVAQRVWRERLAGGASPDEMA